MSKVKALWKFGAAIFGRNNLIGTDITDLEVWKDGHGVVFRFRISHDALGKVSDNIPAEAYEVLGLAD